MMMECNISVIKGGREREEQRRDERGMEDGKEITKGRVSEKR